MCCKSENVQSIKASLKILKCDRWVRKSPKVQVFWDIFSKNAQSYSAVHFSACTPFTSDGSRMQHEQKATLKRTCGAPGHFLWGPDFYVNVTLTVSLKSTCLLLDFNSFCMFFFLSCLFQIIQQILILEKDNLWKYKV